MRDYLCRRDFIKLGLGAATGLSLNSFLSGCATPIIETQEDIVNVHWDSNPAIPVPENGCYIGFYREIEGIRNGWTDTVQQMLDLHKDKFGKRPAVQCISDRKTNRNFPTDFYEKMHENGVLPMMRFHPNNISDFKQVVDGKVDRELSYIAYGAQKYGEPFFFVPFAEANIGYRYSHIHKYANSSPKYFDAAWKHMRHIFKEEGANNAVFGLHLIAYGNHFTFGRHDIDDSLFDWLGFSTYNMERESGQDRSFYNIINRGYSWAKKEHPSKPIALWEFGTSNTSGQSKWIKNAYASIQHLKRIKLALYTEYLVGKESNPHDNTFISQKATPAFKEAISSNYFIGSSS